MEEIWKIYGEGKLKNTFIPGGASGIDKTQYSKAEKEIASEAPVDAIALSLPKYY